MPGPDDAPSSVRLHRRVVAGGCVRCRLLGTSDRTDKRLDVPASTSAAAHRGSSPSFADNAPADAQYYELMSDYRALPPSLEARSALFISGVNRSDDLFMFFKGPVGGLARLVPWRQRQCGSGHRHAGRVRRVGGAPGESVWIKAGATAFEPASHPRRLLPGGRLRASGSAGWAGRSVRRAPGRGCAGPVTTGVRRGKPVWR